MKKVEKILRVVLCFLMLLSTVSLNVTNVNATNYSLSNDGNFLFVLNQVILMRIGIHHQEYGHLEVKKFFVSNMILRLK